MENPIKKLEGSIKTYVVKKGLEHAQAQIDTKPERDQVTRVVVEGLHLPGLPKSYAWLAAIVAALSDMGLEVLASSDPALLLSDWKLYAKAVLVAFVGKFFLWVRQNSANGTAVLETKVIDKINATLAEPEISKAS